MTDPRGTRESQDAHDPYDGRRSHGARAAASDNDRRRLRATWRTLAGGGIFGVIAMIAVALLGGSGQLGLGVLLLFAAVSCVVAALVTALLAMVDEYRRVPAGRTRTIVAVGLFMGGAVLLVMSLGAVSSA